jgi:hypothetical protein
MRMQLCMLEQGYSIIVGTTVCLTACIRVLSAEGVGVVLEKPCRVATIALRLVASGHGIYALARLPGLHHHTGMLFLLAAVASSPPCCNRGKTERYSPDPE